MKMAEAIINLTVIADRSCSTTRTYLRYLRASGLVPQRLWMVDFAPFSPRMRLARALLGERLAGAWRRRRAPAVTAPDAAYRALCLRLQEEAGLPAIDHFAPWEPADHAREVEHFSADGYRDPRLHRRICERLDTAFLYTSGGIVPASLLGRPGVRILHVHPGIVPEVRGSDCLLWSARARKRLGASCFYMSAGIDEGAVIGQSENELPRLPSLAPLLAGGREPEAYRALLFAVDPHFRARLLVDVLRESAGADLRALPATGQAGAARPAYLWMHPRLRARVMREAFL